MNAKHKLEIPKWLLIVLIAVPISVVLAVGFGSFVLAGFLLHESSQESKSKRLDETKPMSLGPTIEHLAWKEGFNVIVDPRVSHFSIGYWRGYSPERILDTSWDHLPPAEALAQLLKENKLKIVTNAATSVARVVLAEQEVESVAEHLINETNAVCPLIQMEVVILMMELKPSPKLQTSK
jgi:hypothetical protein